MLPRTVESGHSALQQRRPHEGKAPSLYGTMESAASACLMKGPDRGFTPPSQAFNVPHRFHALNRHI
jgi:hypothetical protein